MGRVRVSVGGPKDTNNNKYYKLDFIHCFPDGIFLTYS
jgi:hypothetical protein